MSEPDLMDPSEGAEEALQAMIDVQAERIRDLEQLVDTDMKIIAQLMAKLTGKSLKVVIEVSGGVAYVDQRPPEVEVEIIDYDNLDEIQVQRRLDAAYVVTGEWGKQP